MPMASIFQFVPLLDPGRSQERCVFTLTQHGLELTEIAPGIDVERDILAQMDFRPLISEKLRLMDERIFRDSLMGLSLKTARL